MKKKRQIEKDLFKTNNEINGIFLIIIARCKNFYQLKIQKKY